MNGIDPGAWVVSSNPLHSGNGIGVVQQVRGEQAKVEFRPTVFSRPPYLTESRILNINELHVVKTPLDRLRDGDFDEPWRFDLRTRAAQLLVCNRDGQLGDARTDLLPHQISVAHRVVTSPRRRFLIADEMGLGKTIEAGMILYALRQRGQARRVLIVPPAGLTLQWQEEMEDKFGLKFAVYREDVDGPLAFDQMDYLIASVDTLKLDRKLKGGRREGHKTLLLGSRDWDVIIFDEAHKLSAKTWSEQKTDKTLNYRLAEDLQERCRALILLTGTPHQGDESKFQNLMSLLHENITFEEFATGEDGNGPIPYTDLILRNRKSKVTDADGNPIFKGMDIHPVRVNLLDSGEKQFHRALVSYLQEGYGFADQDPGDKRHKAIGFVMTTFQKLAASSTQAIKGALERRMTNLKASAEGARIEAEGEYDARHEGEFETRKASSVRDAFVKTEVGMLEGLLAMAVKEDAKQAELIKVIESVSKDDPKQRILIFTEYLATQDFLIELLEETCGKGCATTIRGGMSLWDKKKSMEAFRDNPRVRFLVSTEAGGEGINLQFAHVMINYDLPWNPFRLAQRYGRLYRYGQDRRVQAFNLQNEGTIEDRVREYLETKTRAAANRLTGVTGETVEEIEEGLLGLFEECLDYEKIYREGLAKGNIKPSQKEIDEGIKRAEQAYETAYASLFSKDIAPFNPERFKHEVQSPLSLQDVREFVLELVRREGRKVTETSDGTYEFLLPDCFKDVQGLKRRYAKVTFDRTMAIRHSEVEFMALGHPFTDAAIQRCASVEFGGMASRRTIENAAFAGTSGVSFIFVVKITKTTAEGESIFFEQEPVFVKLDGSTDRNAAKAALAFTSKPHAEKTETAGLENLDALYQKAKAEVIGRYAQSRLWDEDAVCLNMSLVDFV
jgi:superfamily II DNA or RNA helicase